MAEKRVSDKEGKSNQCPRTANCYIRPKMGGMPCYNGVLPVLVANVVRST